MTDPTGPDDSPTLPNVYGGSPTGTPPPPGFWDELRSEGSSPLAGQPGWSQAGAGYGDYRDPNPADPYAAYGRPAVVIPASAPDGGARRRGALLAVGGVFLATVVVVLATLVIGPHLRPSAAGPTNEVAPPSSPTGSSTSGADPTPTSGVSSPSLSVNPQPVPTMATSTVPPASTASPTAGSTGSAGTTTPGTTGRPAGVSSVTVGTGGSGSGTARPTTSSTVHSAPPAVISTIQPSTAGQQSSTVGGDLGVPLREIPCSNGLIVQLASELTPNAFRARVSQLRGQGLVPGDAAAATSAGSCGIFSNQHNTYILYSGPFGGLQDACNDRLAGPYDAYIKGGNPGSAGTFYSCVCPARADQLPTIGQIGQAGQWVGELQRMLGAHLRYNVGGLDNSSWGFYTKGTRAAVKKFQADHHLKADGVVNAQTWAAIQGAGC